LKHEDPKNIRNVCAEHAPRPDPTLQFHPLPWYVGRHVKRAFHQGEAIEHMWVRVTAVTGATLTGVLANEPTLVDDVQLHDAVTVQLHEIEAVA
jgi:uncharacterized protein YegJ (DUF2314 family)